MVSSCRGSCLCWQDILDDWDVHTGLDECRGGGVQAHPRRWSGWFSLRLEQLSAGVRRFVTSPAVVAGVGHLEGTGGGQLKV